MSVLGAHLSFRAPGSYQITTHYFDIVVDDSGAQDIATSIALFDAVLAEVAKMFPHIKTVTIVSDNGPHFASWEMVYSLVRRNARINAAGNGIFVEEYIFSEPQWGKSCLDTHFAYVKLKLRSWLAEADITTPLGIFTGLVRGRPDASGMLKRTTAALVSPKLHFLPESTSRESARKFLGAKKGIRSVANIRFSSSGDAIEVAELCALKGKRFDFSQDRRGVGFKTWADGATSKYYGDTKTRFPDGTELKRTAIADDAPVSKKGPRDPSNTTRYNTALESRIGSTYDDFNNAAGRKAAAAEERKRASQRSVSEELQKLSSVALAPLEIRTKKKKGQDEGDIVQFHIPGADSMFGLVEGFALRTNQKKTVVPKRILRRARAIFDEGGASGGSKRSPEQAYEDILKAGDLDDWRHRVAVDATRIKEWFSQWAVAAKDKKKNEEALKALEAVVGENDERDVVELSSDEERQLRDNDKRQKRVDSIMADVIDISAMGNCDVESDSGDDPDGRANDDG